MDRKQKEKVASKRQIFVYFSFGWSKKYHYSLKNTLIRLKLCQNIRTLFDIFFMNIQRRRALFNLISSRANTSHRLRVFMSWHWTSLRQWLREYPQSSADKSPGNNVSPLSYTVVAMLMMDLCLAVEFLHARSFVHRAITVRLLLEQGGEKDLIFFFPPSARGYLHHICGWIA